MAGDSKTTTDHDTIRRWAEQRDGVPASVKGTGGDDDPGILRIDFPGGDEDSLEPISWEEWFENFDRHELTFVYESEPDADQSSLPRYRIVKTEDWSGEIG